MKQKLITLCFLAGSIMALSSLYSPQVANANPNWGPSVECDSKYENDISTATDCRVFQSMCVAGFASDDADGNRKNSCEGAGYKYNNSGGLDSEECVGEDCCGGVKTSLLQNTSICDDKDGVVFGLLNWILRLMTAGVGVAAVGGIGYGALLYTTAEGKPEQTKKGIEVITNVVIGIAAYALMFVLLNFLIPGGVFS